MFSYFLLTLLLGVKTFLSGITAATDSTGNFSKKQWNNGIKFKMGIILMMMNAMTIMAMMMMIMMIMVI